MGLVLKIVAGILISFFIIVVIGVIITSFIGEEFMKNEREKEVKQMILQRYDLNRDGDMDPVDYEYYDLETRNDMNSNMNLTQEDRKLINDTRN